MEENGLSSKLSSMPFIKKEQHRCRWRSSRVFIITVIAIAMFSDTFLYSFIIPILPVVLEDRIQSPASQTQNLTSALLSMNALISIIVAPLVGYLADKVSYRNGLLILAWVLNILGTGVTGCSTTLFLLFLGRLIQTFAGSLIWIVGMAILGDAAGPGNLAKAIGFVAIFISAGLLSGPTVSGTLYQLAGYLTTWLTAIALLCAGAILQLLMSEPYSKEQNNDDDDDDNNNIDEEGSLAWKSNSLETEHDETSALLSHSSSPLLPAACPTVTGCGGPEHLVPSPNPPQQSVYWTMLRRPRVLTALTADIIFAVILASFETTIPLHIDAVFGWKSLQGGLLFLLIQLPSLVLLTPAGWLKDKIGMRYPVAVGFVMFGPSLWFLGLPGADIFDWPNRGHNGQIIFIVSLLAIGVWRTLVVGFGAIEVMHAVRELEAQKPNIFGPNGGSARSFSMSNISWKLGMLLGPLISGEITQSFGYYWMNFGLAIVSMWVGISTYIILD